MTGSKKENEDKIIFLNQFHEGGKTLFLYEGLEERLFTLKSFFEDGLQKGETCVYFYPLTEEPLNLSEIFKIPAFQELPLIAGKIKSIQGEDIDYIVEKYNTILKDAEAAGSPGLRVEIDFGKVHKTAQELILNFEERIRKDSGIPDQGSWR